MSAVRTSMSDTANIPYERTFRYSTITLSYLNHCLPTIRRVRKSLRHGRWAVRHGLVRSARADRCCGTRQAGRQTGGPGWANRAATPPGPQLRWQRAMPRRHLWRAEMVDHMAAPDHLIDWGGAIPGRDHLDVRHLPVMPHGQVNVLQGIERGCPFNIAECSEKAESWPGRWYS